MRWRTTQKLQKESIRNGKAGMGKTEHEINVGDRKADKTRQRRARMWGHERRKSQVNVVRGWERERERGGPLTCFLQLTKEENGIWFVSREEKESGEGGINQSAVRFQCARWVDVRNQSSRTSVVIWVLRTCRVPALNISSPLHPNHVPSNPPRPCSTTWNYTHYLK